MGKRAKPQNILSTNATESLKSNDLRLFLWQQPDNAQFLTAVFQIDEGIKDMMVKKVGLYS